MTKTVKEKFKESGLSLERFKRVGRLVFRVWFMGRKTNLGAGVKWSEVEKVI